MPPLTFILLPGLHGTAELFDPLLDVMPVSGARRIISYPTERCLSYDELLALLERELENDRDIVLIAESFSGPLAIRFAAAHPDRVRAVVLVATFIQSPRPSWLRMLVFPFIFRLPMPKFALRAQMLGRGVSDQLARKVITAVMAMRPSVVAFRIRQTLTVDCSDAIKRVTTPMLYLRAERDSIVPRSSLAAILRIRSDVQVKVIPGPHLLLQVNPTACWDAIERFLSGIDPAFDDTDVIR